MHITNDTHWNGCQTSVEACISFIFVENSDTLFSLQFNFSDTCTYDPSVSFGCDIDFAKTCHISFHSYHIALMFCCIQDYAWCSQQTSLLFISVCYCLLLFRCKVNLWMFSVHASFQIKHLFTSAMWQCAHCENWFVLTKY